MITSYALHGDFLESCDCFDLCPCWVDDDPDEDHCTGLVVWRLGEDSTISTGEGGLDVSGAVVAAVTGHSGGRRTASAFTVLYVDVAGCAGQHFEVLADAFTGTEEAGHDGDRKRIDGPLGALRNVTGTVLSPAQPATIALSPDNATDWTVTVTPDTPDKKPGTEAAVRAQGTSRTFPDDPEDPPGGRRSPLELLGTALHAELQIQDSAHAQHTDSLSVRVPALPGGYLEVRARSGMRGTFAYRHPNKHGRGKKNGGRPTAKPAAT